METKKPTLPSIRELHTDIDKFEKQDAINYLCNQQPKQDWVQVNKFAGNSKYIPIGIVESLLQKIFKGFRVEVKEVSQLFNAVSVTVRLHLTNPVDGQPMFFDGVGAAQIQTKAGASPADLGAINNNAVQMALPAAKSYAIKDAAEHIGKLFGRDLNRKDVLEYVPEKSTNDRAEDKEKQRVIDHINGITDYNDLALFANANPEYEGYVTKRVGELRNGK